MNDKTEELKQRGMSSAEAKAEKWVETQNALHNPDQIASGHPEKIEGMGNSSVNQSIGSQWDKHKRAEKLDEYVRGHSEKRHQHNVKKTKLNVKLPKTKR